MRENQARTRDHDDVPFLHTSISFIEIYLRRSSIPPRPIIERDLFVAGASCIDLEPKNVILLSRDRDVWFKKTIAKPEKLDPRPRPHNEP